MLNQHFSFNQQYIFSWVSHCLLKPMPLTIKVYPTLGMISYPIGKGCLGIVIAHLLKLTFGKGGTL